MKTSQCRVKNGAIEISPTFITDSETSERCDAFLLCLYVFIFRLCAATVQRQYKKISYAGISSIINSMLCAASASQFDPYIIILYFYYDVCVKISIFVMMPCNKITYHRDLITLISFYRYDIINQRRWLSIYVVESCAAYL